MLLELGWLLLSAMHYTKRNTPHSVYPLFAVSLLAAGDSLVLHRKPPIFDVWHPLGFNNVLLASVICKCFENFLRKDLSQYWELLDSSTYNKVNIAEKIRDERIAITILDNCSSGIKVLAKKRVGGFCKLVQTTCSKKLNYKLNNLCGLEKCKQ